MLPAIAFYVLAATAIASAFMIIASRNPVHSVLFLIVTFFASAGLFVLIGAEFLALLLVMVYVGAVAVLFLFVVMMLDVDFAEMQKGFLQNLPLGGMIAAILLSEIILVAAAALSDSGRKPVANTDGKSNIQALGDVLYTDYAFFFEAVGLILLIAMIGAIILTLRKRGGVKRQVIADQIARTRDGSVELVDVEPNQGIG